MSYCGDCGTKVPEDADACPNCGTERPWSDSLDWEDSPGAPAWIAWAVVAAVLLGAFVLGAFLVMRTPSPSAPQAGDKSPGKSQKTDKTPTPTTSDSGATTTESTEPTVEVTGTPGPLAGLATAEVPGSAPPNDDVDGSQVTFIGSNLTDGDAETAWRLAGDQTGAVLTLRFPSAVTVTQVGIVNGWAKTTTSTTGTTYDWYHSNRQVLSVEWSIAGQTYTQTLTDSPDLQTMDVTPTAATDIQVKITSVSSPGSVNPRDYTAISELAVTGVAD